MTDRFLGAVQMRMSAMDGSIGQPRMGIVQQIDPQHHLVKVLIMPEQVLSDWLPIATAMVGPGFGAVFMPEPGMQCFLVPDCGDPSHMVVVGHIFSDQAPPPQTMTRPGTGPWTNGGQQTYANPGEMIWMAEGGATLRMNKDGTVYIQADVYMQGNLFVQGDIMSSRNIAALHDINAANNVGANNDVFALADVYDGIGALNRLRQHYNQHEHIFVKAGTDVSGITTALDGASLAINAAGAFMVDSAGNNISTINSTGVITSGPTITTLGDYASLPAQPPPSFSGGG